MMKLLIMEKGSIGSPFMGYGDAESALENLKKCFNRYRLN